MANETLTEAQIKVDNVLLPTPSDYTVSFEDLDSDESKRYISDGKLRRKRIRSEVMKISLSYKLNSLTDVNAMLDALKPATVEVELFLPNEGIRGTKTMYANKKSFKYKQTKFGKKADSFAFDLTEV